MPHRYLLTFLLLLLPFLLLPASAVRAQGLPGYVLTLGGDTLRGILTEEPEQTAVRLLSPNGQLRQFDPTQIRGYGLRGQALIASAAVRRADGSAARHFVLPLLQGPASLYTFANETGLFLQPPSPAADTLYELSARNWHLLLNRYLAGCPNLRLTSNSVLNLPFEERYIVQLLTRYNRCLAPDWRATSEGRKSAYRRGLGGEVDFSYFQSKGLTEEFNTATSQRLLLAGSFIRASGLQTDVGLGYSRWKYATDFSPITRNGQLGNLEEKEQGQFHLLTGLMRVSQRFGNATRPNLLAGLEIGFNAAVRAASQTYQRSTAGGPVVQTASFAETDSGAVPHLAASLGVALPLASRQEIRISTFYQRYLLYDIQAVGLRAAYYFFHQ